MRRLVLLLRGALLDRSRPDLERLERISDPEQFVWAVLPYAARSFAVSILLLPEGDARTCAVAYLYSRMLDTYEDLSPTHHEARKSLDAFAARFMCEPPAPAQQVSSATVGESDEAHLLLLRRHKMVDSVFARLPQDQRDRIVDLVGVMAAGMVDYSNVFESQGGVLEDLDQVSDYCHRVIGYPAIFVLETLSREVNADHRHHALRVSELIQLANITRDIEKDLQVGVAYHPRLRPHLGSDGTGEVARSAVQQARRDLTIMATQRAASFRLLLNEHTLPRFSLARSAAVMMMLFTDRHYRRMAISVGLPVWRGPRSGPAIIMAAFPAMLSLRWADRVLRRAESGLLANS